MQQVLKGLEEVIPREMLTLFDASEMEVSLSSLLFQLKLN